LDHLHALPLLLDNLVGRIPESLTVYGTVETLDALRRHVFNGVLWPDFTVIPTPAAPIVRLQPVEPGRPFSVGTLTAEAVAVEHSVPAVGYVIHDGEGTVVFSGDTGPTTALWERVRGVRDLKAVFLEASFSASWQEFAGRTRHLSTVDVPRELNKADVGPDVPVFLYHFKPDFLAEITREAGAITPWRVRPVQSGEVIGV